MDPIRVSVCMAGNRGQRPDAHANRSGGYLTELMASCRLGFGLAFPEPKIWENGGQNQRIFACSAQFMLTYSVHRVSEYSRTEVCRFRDVPEPFFANRELMALQGDGLVMQRSEWAVVLPSKMSKVGDGCIV